MDLDDNSLYFMAALLLISAGISYLGTRKFVKNAISTIGKVIDRRSMSSYDGGSALIVNVEFLVNEKKYNIAARGSSMKKYDIRDEIDILYSKDNPENAKVDKVSQLYLMELILGGIGLGIILVTIYGK